MSGGDMASRAPGGAKTELFLAGTPGKLCSLTLE